MKNHFQIITLNKKGITDFAKERNRLLDEAKSEWVFFVDSDETISNFPASPAGRQLPISNEFSGYQFIRKNYFLGQYVGEDEIIRLGKKNSGKWIRRVHEVWDIKGKIGKLNNPIIHNTADNLNGYISKINLYSDLHAKANMEEGKKATLFKIIFYPPLKFIVTLVKSKNIVFSIMQSLHSFLSWSKQWLFQND